MTPYEAKYTLMCCFKEAIEEAVDNVVALYHDPANDMDENLTFHLSTGEVARLNDAKVNVQERTSEPFSGAGFEMSLHLIDTTTSMGFIHTNADDVQGNQQRGKRYVYTGEFLVVCRDTTDTLGSRVLYAMAQAASQTIQNRRFDNQANMNPPIDIGSVAVYTGVIGEVQGDQIQVRFQVDFEDRT